MAYKKDLVDNVTCSRRFHLTYDTEAPKLPLVEVRCSYCDVIIFSATDHSAVRLARQENLIQTGMLSDQIIRECHFKDSFSEKTLPDHGDR